MFCLKRAFYRLTRKKTDIQVLSYQNKMRKWEIKCKELRQFLSGNIPTYSLCLCFLVISAMMLFLYVKPYHREVKGIWYSHNWSFMSAFCFVLFWLYSSNSIDTLYWFSISSSNEFSNVMSFTEYLTEGMFIQEQEWESFWVIQI